LYIIVPNFITFGQTVGDILIFVIFKIAVAAVLGLQKFEILTANPL